MDAVCAGIPFNYTVTGCSSANGYNSFEAIFWRDQESGQGRPFQIDTTYGSDSEGLLTFVPDCLRSACFTLLLGHLGKIEDVDAEIIVTCTFLAVWAALPGMKIYTPALL